MIEYAENETQEMNHAEVECPHCKAGFHVVSSDTEFIFLTEDEYQKLKAETGAKNDI
jgi:C4-type Zn-finger protein